MKSFLTTILFFFVSNLCTAQINFTFTGNGNWSDSANWENWQLPPSTLPAGQSILINPISNGKCILDVYQKITTGGVLTVADGKIFELNANLINQPEKRFGGLVESNTDSLLTVPVFDTAAFFVRRLKKNTAIPATFELMMPSPLDQGSQSSCVAWAAAYATRSYHLFKDECATPYLAGNDNSRLMSASFIFNQVKYPNTDCENGTNYFTLLKTMKTLGVSSFLATPFTSTCTQPPTSSQKQNASYFKIVDFYRIQDLSEDNLKAILMQGYPIMIGVRIDDGFLNDGKFVWSKGHGEYAGKHALVICGWDNGKHAFKIMNSWNDSWGFGGFGWIDFQYLNKVIVGNRLLDYNGNWEAFVMKTAPTNYDIGFTLTNAEISRGKEITFTDTTNPKPVSVFWDFPGGTPSSSTEKSVKVRYDTAGTYPVLLTINYECSTIRKQIDATINVLEDSLFTDPNSGQVYPFRRIGNQVWMTKNLDVATYRNGDTIPEVKDFDEWKNLTTGAWCYYNNDQISLGSSYGKLYNWYAVTDPRGLAPVGWKIPTISDWADLSSFLGADAGAKLKDTGYVHWIYPNNATNITGFSAYAGGARAPENTPYLGFSAIKTNGFFWTSSTYDAAQARFMYLNNQSKTMGLINYYPKGYGLSIRCLKE